jgi:CDP-glycerol glycerophosphotransferase (TagB/SpsB family)
VITWNDTNSKEVEIFHDIKQKHIFTGGIAHWDQYFKKEAIWKDRISFCQKYSLHPDKKILFYALSGPRHYERRFDVIRGILETISSGQVAHPSQLLVRFHPIYVEEDGTGKTILDHNENILNELILEYGELVKFWIPKRPHMNQQDSLSMSDMLDMANAIRVSDLVIQEYSTLILESAIFDKPLINMSIYYYGNLMHFTHLKHVFKYKSLRDVRTFEEFSKVTNNYLSDPSIDQQQRRSLFENEVAMNSGAAGSNIGSYILEQLN